jgi:hypothetical protein
VEEKLGERDTNKAEQRPIQGVPLDFFLGVEESDDRPDQEEDRRAHFENGFRPDFDHAMSENTENE